VFVVVILLARRAAPDVENPPGAVMAFAALKVNSPELVTATAPPEAAVKLLLTLYATPRKVAEPTFTVLEKVVVPVAALVCVRAPVILSVLLKLSAPELAIVTTASFVAKPDPTAPVNVTVPAAASTMSVEVEVPAPSVAPPIVTPPEPAVRVVVTPLPIVRAPPPVQRFMSELVVEMLLERVVTPDVENPAGAVIAPAALKVNSPELVTATAPPEAAVKLLLTLYATPRKVAEPTFTVPEKVVVPVAASAWLNTPDMAMAPLKLVIPAFVTVTVASPVVSAEVPEP